MGEQYARPVVIGKDQRPLERSRCQHHPIGTDMPNPNAGTIIRRGIPKVVTTPLNSYNIILVIQANGRTSAQVGQVFMRENFLQGRGQFLSELPQVPSGPWLIVDQQHFPACTQMLFRCRNSGNTGPYHHRINIAIGLVVTRFIGLLWQCTNAGKAACSQSRRHFYHRGRQHRFLCARYQLHQCIGFFNA